MVESKGFEGMAGSRNLTFLKQFYPFRCRANSHKIISSFLALNLTTKVHPCQRGMRTTSTIASVSNILLYIQLNKNPLVVFGNYKLDFHYANSIFLNGPTPVSLFLFIFVLFNNNFTKNCTIPMCDSNMDHRRRRQTRWPIEHLHGPQQRALCFKII